MHVSKLNKLKRMTVHLKKKNWCRNNFHSEIASSFHSYKETSDTLYLSIYIIFFLF